MSHFPGHIVFELTYRCNYRCRFCYCADCSAKREMSVDEWVRILREIQSYGGAREVTLSGGEPLLYSDVIRLVRLIGDVGVDRVQLFTNLSLLEDRQLDALRECGTVICTSVSGRSTYQQATGGVGDYDHVMRKVHECTGKGMKTYVSSILTRENFEELESVADDCFAAGALGVQFGYIMHEGAALRNRDLWLTWRQRVEIARRVKALRSKYADKLIMFSDETVCSCRSAVTRACARICGRRCTMGTKSIVVSPDGMVRPCVHDSGRKPFVMFTDDQSARFRKAADGYSMW